MSHNEHIREWLRYRVKLYHRMIRARSYYTDTLKEYIGRNRVKNNSVSNVVNIKINSK
jgi:hypothetical protein